MCIICLPEHTYYEARSVGFTRCLTQAERARSVSCASCRRVELAHGALHARISPAGKSFISFLCTRYLRFGTVIAVTLSTGLLSAATAATAAAVLLNPVHNLLLSHALAQAFSVSAQKRRTHIHPAHPAHSQFYGVHQFRGLADGASGAIVNSYSRGGERGWIDTMCGDWRCSNVPKTLGVGSVIPVFIGIGLYGH